MQLSTEKVQRFCNQSYKHRLPPYSEVRMGKAEAQQLTGQPTAIAGETLRVIMDMGKFQGVMAATTPTGCLMTTGRLLADTVCSTSPFTLRHSSANHSMDAALKSYTHYMLCFVTFSNFALLGNCRSVEFLVTGAVLTRRAFTVQVADEQLFSLVLYCCTMPCCTDVCHAVCSQNIDLLVLSGSSLILWSRTKVGAFSA